MSIPLLDYLTTNRIDIELRDNALAMKPLFDVDPDVEGQQLIATFYQPNGATRVVTYGGDMVTDTDPDGNVSTTPAGPGNTIGRTGTGKYYVETHCDQPGPWMFQISVAGALAQGVIDGTFSVGLDPAA